MSPYKSQGNTSGTQFCHSVAKPSSAVVRTLFRNLSSGWILYAFTPHFCPCECTPSNKNSITVKQLNWNSKVTDSYEEKWWFESRGETIYILTDWPNYSRENTSVRQPSPLSVFWDTYAIYSVENLPMFRRLMSSLSSGLKSKLNKNNSIKHSKKSDSSTIKMEAVISSETSVNIHRTARCYVTTDATISGLILQHTAQIQPEISKQAVNKQTSKQINAVNISTVESARACLAFTVPRYLCV